MRILHVIDRFHLGGSEEHATSLAVGLVERGHQCAVVAVRRPTGTDEVGESQKARLSNAEIPFAEIGGPSVGRNLLLTPFRLLGWISRFKPDLVHVNTDIPELMVSLALRMRKFQVVRTIHNTSLWETRPQTGRICEAGFEEDLVIAVSQGALSAHQKLRAQYGLAQSSHQSVVLGSVSSIPEHDSYARSHLVKKFGANGSKMLLCFAGRLVEQKGFDTLIDAITGLDREVLEKVELHVFTAGEGLEGFKEHTHAKNLPILFHEPVAQIANLFPAFDGILMPSRWEGYGRVAAEGFLAGTPVLASDAPGLRETFPPNWPLKVPPNNPAALREAVRDLLDGHYDLLELGRAASDWARHVFSVDREVDEYAEAYADYLDGCRRGAPQPT